MLYFEQRNLCVIQNLSPKARFCYAIPDFQYSASATLSAEDLLTKLQKCDQTASSHQSESEDDCVGDSSKSQTFLPKSRKASITVSLNSAFEAVRSYDQADVILKQS
jgi:hypothetical protein